MPVTELLSPLSAHVRQQLALLSHCCHQLSKDMRSERHTEPDTMEFRRTNTKNADKSKTHG